MIKLGSFSNWWSVLKSSSAVKDTNEETDVYRFEYKDGTVQDVKQEEHSVSKEDPGPHRLERCY